MEKSLLVLAAGMGSRFGGLKQMEGFGPSGETLLEYSVFDAIQAGFQHAVFVIRKSMEKDFFERVLAKFEGRIAIDLVFQETNLQEVDWKRMGTKIERTKPWGTGHAVKVGLASVRGPFLVINADDFYGRRAIAAGADFLNKENSETPFAIIAYLLERTLSRRGSVSRGVISVNDRHELIDIREHHQIEPRSEGIQYLDDRTKIKSMLNRNALVSLNLLALTPEIANPLDLAWDHFLHEFSAEDRAEFGIPDVLVQSIASGHKVKVLQTEETWMGVTHPDDAQWVSSSLRKLVMAGQYPEQLWS